MIYNTDLNWNDYKCVKPFKLGIKNDIQVKFSDIIKMAINSGIAYISLSDTDPIEHGLPLTKLNKKLVKL